MTWAKFGSEFDDHPKIAGLNPLAIHVHEAAIRYCARYLTDGIVPDRAIPGLVSWHAIDGLFGVDAKTYVYEELGMPSGDTTDAFWDTLTAMVCRDIDSVSLVDDVLHPAGLWHRYDDDSCHSETCRSAPQPESRQWLIHDYLEHNWSRGQYEARRTAGHQGGKASARARAKHMLDQTPSTTPSEPQAVSVSVSVSEQGQEQHPFAIPAAPSSPSNGASKPSPRKHRRDYSAEFTTFWSAWQGKEGKAEAERAFSKAMTRDGVTVEFLLDRIAAYETFLARTPGRQRLHAATYLNQERYLDEYPDPNEAVLRLLREHEEE